jgi:hypothetical protein
VVWTFVQTAETRSTYSILVGKPNGKRPYRRSQCKLEASIQWILKVRAVKMWTDLTH